MSNKITKEQAIGALADHDVEQTPPETLADIFIDGTPGYKSFSDDEIKEFYIDLILKGENADTVEFDF